MENNTGQTLMTAFKLRHCLERSCIV